MRNHTLPHKHNRPREKGRSPSRVPVHHQAKPRLVSPRTQAFGFRQGYMTKLRIPKMYWQRPGKIVVG